MSMPLSIKIHSTKKDKPNVFHTAFKNSYCKRIMNERLSNGNYLVWNKVGRSYCVRELDTEGQTVYLHETTHKSEAETAYWNRVHQDNLNN